MPEYIVNILTQTPFAAILIWYSLTLNKEFQKFLLEERAARQEMLEAERTSREEMLKAERESRLVTMKEERDMMERSINQLTDQVRSMNSAMSEFRTEMKLAVNRMDERTRNRETTARTRKEDFERKP